MSGESSSSDNNYNALERHVEVSYVMHMSTSMMMSLMMLVFVTLYILSETIGTSASAFKWILLCGLLLAAMAFIILVFSYVLRPASRMRKITKQA